MAVAASAPSPASGGKKKAKKSRKPLHIAPPKMKSRRKARQVTTDFHRLTHELDEVKKDARLSAEDKRARAAELTARIDAIGGRAAYQDARQDDDLGIILSTSFHKTSKWVFQLLTSFGLRPKSKEPPLRLLEVGAINTQLLSCPWLDVRAIDLNSRHDKIEQCDFFSLTPAREFRVIVSSMVLNCVPDPTSRGRMLQLYYEHLQPGGLLFLMVPLLCLRHSRFMTYDRFKQILEAVGFRVKETKDSPKVSFFCLEKRDDPPPKCPLGSGAKGKATAPLFPHKLLVPGDKRNAFSVVV